MAKGLGEKTLTFLGGKAHGLVDLLIKSDSISYIKQNIRELEDGIEELEEAYATEAGNVRGLTRARNKKQDQIDEARKNIDVILADDDESNDASAEALMASVITYEEELETINSELQTGTETANKYLEVLNTLRENHRSVMTRLASLEAKDRAAKAQEKAADSLEQAASLASGGLDAAGVDDVSAAIQRRKDVADVRLERALGSAVNEVDKNVLMSKARSMVAQRKAELVSTGNLRKLNQPQPRPKEN